MNRMLYYPICIISGLMIVLAGCAGSSVETSTPAEHANNSVSEMLVSWPRSYDDLKRLAWADLIVEGSIASVQETRLLGPTIFTDYRVNISRVLKSYPGFADRSIIMVDLGGTYQGKTQVVKENPPYQIGEQVLLFLRDISNDPVHTPQGQTKYDVMIPGGRFRINPNGTLDADATELEVAKTYRGKEKSVLEKDILALLPTVSDYVRSEVAGSFLIVEGRVGQPETRLTRDEDTQDIYTLYPFTVDKVFEDKLTRAENALHKTNLFKAAPVKVGNVITVVEMGGTNQGVTKRRTWSQFLQPGARMFLSLGAMACGDVSARGAHSPLCTKQEQDTNKILYMLGDSTSRFLIGLDNRYTAITQHGISRLYNGQPKERLEQDLLKAKTEIDKALEEQKKQPTPVPPPFPPPPPTAAPRP